MSRAGQVLLFAACVAGCGADELNASTTATTQEQPVTPLGTVSGQVLTTALSPLEGAQVRLTVGAAARSTTTDDEGGFSFADVPAGSDVLVTVKKDNFASVHTTARIPSAAGQFPLAGGNARVGPVVLAALDGSLQFLVQDESGRPAEDARVRLEASPTGVAHGSDGLSRVVTETRVDASGLARFTGIPSPLELMTLGGAYALWVEPLDQDADGFPDLNGSAATFAAGDLVTDGLTRTLVLTRVTGASRTFTVETGNVGSLFGRPGPSDNLVGAGEPVRLVFSQPVEKNSIVARLTDEYGLEELPVTVAVEGGGRTLLVTPGRALPAGAEFNLHVRANARTGELFAKTGFFFVGDRSAPKALAIAAIRYQETSHELPSRLNQGETVYVEFDQVIAKTGAAAPRVEVFFAADINGDNRVGDTVGELGNPMRRGLELVPAEPTGPVAALYPDQGPVFPLQKSNYTTRYSFVYDGSVTLDPGLVQLTVNFDLLRERTADVYETVWGAPIAGALSSGIQGIPPPPEEE